MRRHVFTSEKTGIWSVPYPWWFAYQRSGDFVHLYSSQGKMYRVFEDGTALYSCNIVSWMVGPIMGSIEHNLLGSGYTFYRMDQSTGARREVIAVTVPAYLYIDPLRILWLEKEYRFVRVNYYGYASIYTLEQDKTVTGPVSAGNVDVWAGGGWKQLIPYKEGLFVVYNRENGRLAILDVAHLLSSLDAEASKISDTAIGVGFDYVWYTPWNKMFHGITWATGTVAAYVDMVQPDVLSEPELLDIVSPLHPVQGTRLRTRLTSAVVGHPTQAFEPVKDWLVDWNLAGFGALQRSQSKTDKDGYAENYYYGPLTGAGLPAQTEVDVSILD